MTISAGFIRLFAILGQRVWVAGVWQPNDAPGGQFAGAGMARGLSNVGLPGDALYPLRFGYREDVGIHRDGGRFTFGLRIAPVFRSGIVESA